MDFLANFKTLYILLVVIIIGKCDIITRKPTVNLINKVTLTQRGYVQFLKYMTEIPSITDFTFCLWMKSTNLTYSHPLFSYTKDGSERIIRVWVNNRGRNINMALLEHDVFQIPIKLKENHWYHICPSWNSKRGLWSLHINGKLIETGRYQKMQDINFPPGGEIAIGQELTDIDTASDDGIEGDIYGFNMVLAHAIIAKTIKDSNRRYYYLPSIQPTKQQQQVYDVTIKERQYTDVPQVLSYFKTTTNRSPKGIIDIGRNMLQNLYNNIFEPSTPPQKIRITTTTSNTDHHITQPRISSIYPFIIRQANHKTIVRPYTPLKRIYQTSGGGATKNDLIIDASSGGVVKPLGLILIELSYNNCALGRGAPLHNDEKVLISWTKTPVRVFGGAILKTIEPFCIAK